MKRGGTVPPYQITAIPGAFPPISFLKLLFKGMSNGCGQRKTL
jgi:hypothetical protein